MSRVLYLAPDVHAVALADDIVVLDVGSDVYRCIPGGAFMVRPLSGGRLDVVDDAAAEALLDAGLANQADGATRRKDPPPPPKFSIEAAPGRPPRPRDLLILGLGLLELIAHYRRRPLAEILAYVARRRPRRAQDVSQAELAIVVGRFRQAAIWLPAPRKCLIRSFLLLRFLHRHGLDADWVFAVRTWPFSAHCWLQAGEVALDEVPDRVRAFAAIAVV